MARRTGLLASSAAALILPMVGSLHLGGEPVLRMLPQVAIADTACIVALPLAVDPHHAGRVALGAAAVLIAAATLFVILRYLDRSGILRRVHRVSQHRKFALELGTNVVVLFALAALAADAHVSVMLAGAIGGDEHDGGGIAGPVAGITRSGYPRTRAPRPHSIGANRSAGYRRRAICRAVRRCGRRPHRARRRRSGRTMRLELDSVDSGDAAVRTGAVLAQPRSPGYTAAVSSLVQGLLAVLWWGGLTTAVC
jgi:hypothetical protein